MMHTSAAPKQKDNAERQAVRSSPATSGHADSIPHLAPTGASGTISQLQAAANSSPRTLPMEEIQQMAGRSPQAAELAQWQQRMNPGSNRAFAATAAQCESGETQPSGATENPISSYREQVHSHTASTMIQPKLKEGASFDEEADDLGSQLGQLPDGIEVLLDNLRTARVVLTRATDNAIGVGGHGPIDWERGNSLLNALHVPIVDAISALNDLLADITQTLSASNDQDIDDALCSTLKDKLNGSWKALGHISAHLALDLKWEELPDSVEKTTAMAIIDEAQNRFLDLTQSFFSAQRTTGVIQA